MRFLTLCCALLVSAVTFADEPKLPQDYYRYMQETAIREEMELMDDQLDKLRDLQHDFIRESVEARKASTGLPRQSRAEAFREQHYSGNAKIMETMFAEVLLPHQVKRFKQCVWQSMAAKDLVGTLQAAELVNPTEAVEMRKAYQLRQQELVEMVQKHHAETERLLMKSLPASKQRLWANMTGEPARIERPLPRALHPQALADLKAKAE